MPTSVSNNSKWTTNNSWPFSWPFYSYPPLPHELTMEINMSSPWKSTWAHTGNQHELTLETNMTLPGNQHEPSWKNHPPHESFINRIYQQDIPANPRRPTSPITMSSEQPIWTHLNNPSETHQRLIHIEIPNNPI